MLPGGQPGSVNAQPRWCLACSKTHAPAAVCKQKMANLCVDCGLKPSSYTDLADPTLSKARAPRRPNPHGQPLCASTSSHPPVAVGETIMVEEDAA